MIIAKCPECSTTLKAFLSDETFFDWVICRQCSTPSFISLDSYGELKVLSFPGLWKKLSPAARKALKMLAVKDRTYSELTFLSGKESEKDLPELEKMKVIEKSGDMYTLNQKIASSAKDL